MSETAGRIDVHAHLLPGVDDGCKTLDDSLRCARRMVEAGYRDLVCTPHIWPSFPENNVKRIPARVASLQRALDEASIPLALHAGGEINLVREVQRWTLDETPTYRMRGRHCLVDFWFEDLPTWFEAAVKHLQSLGLTVIVAHPERVKVVQRQPKLLDQFAGWGLLLQGNLQCLADPVGTPTRDLVERFLLEGRYHLLGSDLHGPDTLEHRMRGLERAIELLGDVAVDRLTRDHPRALIAG